MFSKSSGSTVATLLSWCLLIPGSAPAQQPVPQAAAGAAQKYKLTILESAPTTRRSKKGRVASQAVVRVTDENNVPVPGITVTFLLPQIGTSGATFSTGATSAVITTNATGIASSGSISSTAGTSFSVGVSAATPSGVVTSTAAISTVGITAGVSTAVIVVVAAVVVAGAAVAAKVATGSSSNSTTPPVPSGSIGGAGTVTFGHQ